MIIMKFDLYIGKAIAFSTLVIATTVLEIYDKPTEGLWILIVIWAIFSDWYPTNKNE